MDMLIPLALINVAAFVWLVLAIRHVRGLIRGCGQGMHEWQSFDEALDNEVNAIMATATVLVADLLALTYFLTHT
ncbi:MAG: hypothetical protein JAY60_19565 [Candidatus Thiodiazotropha weberae]|nr:hypothetical protein [Candidatus Thiodiazotropha weberae]MCG7904609.1 hypothetical protein [Candidatus Thiodiazotropha weberae]